MCHNFIKKNEIAVLQIAMYIYKHIYIHLYFFLYKEKQ